MKWEKYLFPASIEEALAMLEEHQGRARVIAGGTDLVPELKRREREVECACGRISTDTLHGHGGR